MPGRHLVVEADGGSRGNPGPAAYGALVRDAQTGEVLVELAETIGEATNNVAEYRGLLAGLRAACDIDPTARVEARLDSKLVVEQMSGRWSIKNPVLRDIALAARAVLPGEQVRYTWVPRSANAHADRLLNQALDAQERGLRWTPQPAAPKVRVDEAEVEPALPGEQRGGQRSGQRRAQDPARLVGWAPDLGSPTSLLLLRHGETAYTVEKRFSGSGVDPGLTDRGQWQADRAAQALAERDDITVVLSSPFRRARETAEIAAATLAVEVVVDDGLRECEFGEWDGHTFAEVQERWPSELSAWLGSTSVAPPGGECFDAVATRVRQARDRILQQHAGTTLLVVTHVTPVKTLVRLALGAPPEAVFRMEMDAASLTTIQWYADGYASLRSYNDTAHLRRD